MPRRLACISTTDDSTGLQVLLYHQAGGRLQACVALACSLVRSPEACVVSVR